MYYLESSQLRLAVHGPADGFYLGTRFDRSGVLDSLQLGGKEICGRWFEHYHPRMHDAVCGPAEEFTAIGYRPGGHFLKIGVGVLRADDAPYDRFHLYEMEDPGEWTVVQREASLEFCHRLKGLYEYHKTLELSGENRFEIRHELLAFQPLEGQVYNHNFFTMGRMEVGPGRKLDFPFTPAGTWRALYDSVAFRENGVRFSRRLEPGESVFSGDIHESGKVGMPYSLRLTDRDISVQISGNVPVTHTVLWANHRIACLEPYNFFSSTPESPFSWRVQYELFKNT